MNRQWEPTYGFLTKEEVDQLHALPPLQRAYKMAELEKKVKRDRKRKR